jgi:pilus assembly protein CpaC
VKSERGKLDMRVSHSAFRFVLAFVLVAAMQAVGAEKADVTTISAHAQAQGETTPAQAQVPQSSLAPEAQSVHIQVGRSIVLNTQSRLRRIVVSNPAVLDTATVSTTQVVVTAKIAGTSSLVLWDEGANARILDVYADVDVSGLREGVHSAYPGEPVQIEAEQGRVLVSGKVSGKVVADDVMRMAAVYSKDVVDFLVIGVKRQKQVMLKVRFAEVDRTRLEQFGINLLGANPKMAGTTSTGQFGPPSLPANTALSATPSALSPSSLLNIFLYRPDINLGATIQDLQEKNVLQILAEPNLLARSGEPAKFLAGGEFPFPVVQGGAGGTAASVTIMFKPYGVKLEFTATVEGDVIRLKVMPEVSTLDFTNAVVISGFEIPALATRRAETEVDLRDGQSFGIAGLLDKRTTAQLSKMPGIGDIPILGNLFKSRSLNQTNSELLVMVTPVLVDTLSDNAMTAPASPTPALPNMEDKKFDKTMDGKFNPETAETTNKK